MLGQFRSVEIQARQSNSAEGVRQHQPLGAAIRRLPQERAFARRRVTQASRSLFPVLSVRLLIASTPWLNPSSTGDGLRPLGPNFLFYTLSGLPVNVHLKGLARVRLK